MEIVSAISFVISIFLTIVGAYFVVIMLFAFGRLKKYEEAEPATKFAVIIPARNEETVIAGIVGSLNAQEYPPELFDVYVAPNNCKDGTESAAREAGADIIKCENPVHYKGDVLKEAFEQLSGRGYDAFCVFDADNIAAPDYFRKMNNAFKSGARVCKSRRMTKNPYNSQVSGSYTLYFEIFNLLFNRARSNLGLSSPIDGTGFAISREVIEKIGGWSTESITEDAEITAIMALAGECVEWVPDAITYDEQPTTWTSSFHQRMRWCSGFFLVSKKMMPKIFTKLAKRGQRFQIFDEIMILTMPYTQAAGVVSAAAGLAIAVYGGAPAVAGLGITIVVSYLAASVFAAALSAAAGYNVARMWKGILTFPVFMVMWFPIQLFAIFHKTSDWRNMRHTGVSEKDGLAKPRV
ncbi:MAG: glycosyltransferase [Oscillospiraceae bacterium]|jgi:cellulose synthase/poly-beta-1,6-N-acetylglucosamine synthase-like glycosyltransferase|nr:glycosyltransferase [Oscillospiraceae bacterium]